MRQIAIDIGYSSTKYADESVIDKVPTAITPAIDNGLQYGKDDNVYSFEGDNLYVGTVAASGESFTTTSYKFLYKYAPLIIYHIREVLNIPIEEEIVIKTGLALVDWKNKEEFIQRISNCEVNGKVIKK